MKEFDVELIGLSVERLREYDLVIIEVSLYNEDGKRCGVQKRGSLARFEERTNPYIPPTIAQYLSRQMVDTIRRYFEKRGVMMSNESHILDEVTRAMLLINGDFISYDFRTQEVHMWKGTSIVDEKM